MPRKSNTKRANGSGTIRKRKDGTWEARYTARIDTGSGKQIQLKQPQSFMADATAFATLMSSSFPSSMVCLREP